MPLFAADSVRHLGIEAKGSHFEPFFRGELRRSEIRPSHLWDLRLSLMRRVDNLECGETSFY